MKANHFRNPRKYTNYYLHLPDVPQKSDGSIYGKENLWRLFKRSFVTFSLKHFVTDTVCGHSVEMTTVMVALNSQIS